MLSCLVLLILPPRRAPRGAFFNPRTLAQHRCVNEVETQSKHTFPTFEIPHAQCSRRQPNQAARRRATRAISISRARRRAHPSPARPNDDATRHFVPTNLHGRSISISAKTSEVAPNPKKPKPNPKPHAHVGSDGGGSPITPSIDVSADEPTSIRLRERVHRSASDRPVDPTGRWWDGMRADGCVLGGCLSVCLWDQMRV